MKFGDTHSETLGGLARNVVKDMDIFFDSDRMPISILANGRRGEAKVVTCGLSGSIGYDLRVSYLYPEKRWHFTDGSVEDLKQRAVEWLVNRRPHDGVKRVMSDAWRQAIRASLKGLKIELPIIEATPDDVASCCSEVVLGSIYTGLAEVAIGHIGEVLVAARWGFDGDLEVVVGKSIVPLMRRWTKDISRHAKEIAGGT